MILVFACHTGLHNGSLRAKRGNLAGLAVILTEPGRQVPDAGDCFTSFAMTGFCLDPKGKVFA